MEVVTKLHPEIVQRGEWFEFKTEGGLRLSTKNGQVAAVAQQLAQSGQPGVVNYTERTSDKINQHTGLPYMNRYLDSVRQTTVGAAIVEAAGSVATPIAPNPTAAPDERGAKMGRNNIAAAAVPAIIAGSDGQPQTIQAILDGLSRWSETGQPLFVQPAQSFAQPPLPADDIPF